MLWVFIKDNSLLNKGGKMDKEITKRFFVRELISAETLYNSNSPDSTIEHVKEDIKERLLKKIEKYIKIEIKDWEKTKEKEKWLGYKGIIIGKSVEGTIEILVEVEENKIKK